MKGPAYSSDKWDFLGEARGYYVLRRKSQYNKEFVFTSTMWWIDGGERRLYKKKAPLDGYSDLYELLK